ncbi:LysE family translocator [Ornithinimicrobium cavernae]|uniref:LysE family translocator n=1 Tax=Ornithinimicrobium cavernae TaxID=2666047 RepID=UPI001F2583B8|nr:LysE family translocator [Ornithinimicrobium cavernae]
MESWLAFVAALVVALAVPGPDLVLVVQSSTRGVREGVSTAAGVVTGLTVHAVLAVVGATALVMSVPSALSVVRLLGAAVLLWMGASMLRSSAEATATASASGPALHGGYARGLVTNVTNPKALLFFAAILPQFIGIGEGAGLRTVALCATVVVGSELWWSGTIALVHLLGLQRSPAADRVISLVGGASLLLIGAGLLASTVLDRI